MLTIDKEKCWHIQHEIKAPSRWWTLLSTTTISTVPQGVLKGLWCYQYADDARLSTAETHQSEVSSLSKPVWFAAERTCAFAAHSETSFHINGTNLLRKCGCATVSPAPPAVIHPNPRESILTAAPSSEQLLTNTTFSWWYLCEPRGADVIRK